jgi:hypothetical protein
MDVEIVKVLVVDVENNTEEKGYGLNVNSADLVFSTKRDAELAKDRIEKAATALL